jgi:hypothetical protein
LFFLIVIAWRQVEQGLIRQWLLHYLRFIPWRTQPRVNLLGRAENYRHCLRVNWLYHSVGLGSQESKDIDLDGAFFLLPYTFPCRPDASKGKERLLFV